MPDPFHNLDLKKRRLRLEKAWASYMHTRATALPETPLKELGAKPSNISADVKASWKRSSQHIQPDHINVKVDDPEETLREWRDSLLYAAAEPVIPEIEKTADDSNFIVAITDGTGKILWTHSSKHMLARAEQVNFLPGGHWDETSAGTNALDMALRNLEPSTVFSAEHYLQSVHDWVCYSAPIRDPQSGLALGVLDFSTTWNRANPLGPLTVTALTKLIEQRLQHLAPFTPTTKQPHETLQADLVIRVCGPTSITLYDTPVKLTPRQLEILTILALHPEGLNLDALYTHLYGEQEVSTSTLKAEISQVRKLLDGQIGSRPYRLTLPHALDVTIIQQRLEAGDVLGALTLYEGELLPYSESPRLHEWRAVLGEAVRSAVLQSHQAESVWLYSSHHPDDFEVLLILTRLLPANDPRLHVVRARVELLKSDF